MRNVIILGSGRSGTSMVAGTLAQAGCFMGDTLYPGDEGNPKGYFEDKEINAINEELLAQVVSIRPPGIIGNLFFRSRLVDWQRWLALVPLRTSPSISATPNLLTRIKALTEHEPFCFKDPRFCYTLHVWRPFIKKAALICVFRHPAETANSLVKEAQRESRLRRINLQFGVRDALQLWELMYGHVLEIHYPQGGNWLFIHYNQFLNGSAFDKLEKTLGAAVDHDFVEPSLRRSATTDTASQRILSLYQQLCNLAAYSE